MKLTGRKLIIAAALTGGVTAVSMPAHAAYNLTLCGASPGGLWSLLGAGIDAAVKAAYPGSTVTYQTSGGGFANVALLQQEKCDLAIIHDAEAITAKNGEEPFQSKIDNLRTVAVLYTWAPMQLLVNEDWAKKSGVASLEDIAKKKLPVRILLNRRGNVASSVGEDMLAAAGASIKDIEKWGGTVTFAASKEQGELMRDRRADAILNSLFVNHSSIRQIAEAIDLNILPISKSTAQKVVDKWKVGTFTIPGNSYPWAPNDVFTVTLSAQLFARADKDGKMVKDVTKALVDHADKLQGVHKAMKPLSPKLMASSEAVAYHPASTDVYKAAGLK